jgi:hypothetical protein
VAIGAESWGTLLAAAPDLRAALHDLYEEINSRFCSDTDMTPELLRAIIASRAALAKATL